ncbi:glycosyltransferase family 2 protein [Kineobactrum salinum]|uniref:Glycosyltransferase family 2 protein n=2 Tax=Kineobactrum salinum TaxID=2708301 RepID=A0A6C0UCB4_9GAMM|nr:glycosyltransferase family 2 protein [Kineobactrum salinum]
MTRHCSFIIPVLNEAPHIASVLQTLAERFPEAQRIVVDGGSTDATVAQALPHCTQLLLGARGRAAQMNLGARVASGDYLLFLHADSVPDFDMQQLTACLHGRPQWGFCRLRLSGRQPVFRLLEWAINRRSSLSGIGTGDQMLLLRRDVFERNQGFATLPLMEDVELCARLRQQARPRVLPLTVETSSRRWEQRGVARTVLQMWALRLGFALGVAPAHLSRAYYGRQL